MRLTSNYPVRCTEVLCTLMSNIHLLEVKEELDSSELKGESQERITLLQRGVTNSTTIVDSTSSIRSTITTTTAPALHP